MNNILNKAKLLTVAATMAMASSCVNLDIEPKGFYSDKNFYQNVEDANSALLYAYDGMTYNSYTQALMYFSELASDNCNVKLDEGADAVQIMNWEVNANNEILLQFYRSIYITINRANAVIENVPGKGFDEAIEKQLLGEAYFLRALNHFYAIKTFGLSPLQNSLIDKLDETNAKLPRDMQEAYTFMINDCEMAIENMGVKKIMGRADKVAAQALLAKIYLFAASAKESGVPLYDKITMGVEELYAKAADYSSAVLFDQSTYGFEDNLLNIYDVEKTQSCPEHIFTISFDRSGVYEGDYSALSKYYIPYIAGGTVYLKNEDGSLSPTHDGWSVMQPTNEIKQLFGTSDLRRTLLMANMVYDGNGNVTASTEDGSLQYEFSRKFIDPKFEGDKGSTRPYLLRYADIQLVYAEATTSAEGLEQLNMIRKRAGVAELSSDDFAAMSKEEFRSLVIDERQKELAFEWDRLWDLRRKNIVGTKVMKAQGLTPNAQSFFPIPQREIDLNPNI